MPMHITREVLPGYGMPLGLGPMLPVGFVMPIAAAMGLGVANRMPQAGRMEVSSQLPPEASASSARVYRLADPRTLDATRLLDFGAPAPRTVVEYAPEPYRLASMPDMFRNDVALGGRHVMVR